MRILFFMTLMLIFTSAQATKYDVKCYSNNALIYSKTVDHISQLDGLIVMKNGNQVTFTNGNCVIEYEIPKKK